MEYSNIEKSALDFMFWGTNFHAFELMIKQINNSKVISREFTWAWFFTEIQVEDSPDYKLNVEHLIFGDILIEVSWKPYLWFLFYLKNWYLVQIEWYIYWDSKLYSENSLPTQFNLNYLRDSRDIPDILKNELQIVMDLEI